VIKQTKENSKVPPRDEEVKGIDYKLEINAPPRGEEVIIQTR
jgi:hypothetical protein